MITLIYRYYIFCCCKKSNNKIKNLPRYEFNNLDIGKIRIRYIIKENCLQTCLFYIN